MARAAAAPCFTPFCQCSTAHLASAHGVIVVGDVARGERCRHVGRHGRRRRSRCRPARRCRRPGRSPLDAEPKTARLHSDATTVSRDHALDLARSLERRSRRRPGSSRLRGRYGDPRPPGRSPRERPVERCLNGSTATTSRPDWRIDAATSAPDEAQAHHDGTAARSERSRCGRRPANRAQVRRRREIETRIGNLRFFPPVA